MTALALLPSLPAEAWSDGRIAAAYLIFFASYLVFALGKFPGMRNLEHPAAFTVVTALLSNLVSNVPAVMLMKSLVPGFANPHTGWLVLAMASTLAGNLTITGSVANIIVVERAKPEVEISFRDYFEVGLPITVLTLLVGWGWLELIG